MTAFGEEFKAARAAGKTTFRWQGKTYHTKTKDEMAKVKAKAERMKQVPTPTPRPDTLANEAATKPTTAAPNRSRPAHDYPRPAKAVGLARAGSGLSKIAARRENDASPSGNAFAMGLLDEMRRAKVAPKQPAGFRRGLTPTR